MLCNAEVCLQLGCRVALERELTDCTITQSMKTFLCAPRQSGWLVSHTLLLAAVKSDPDSRRKPGNYFSCKIKAQVAFDFPFGICFGIQIQKHLKIKKIKSTWYRDPIRLGTSLLTNNNNIHFLFAN